MVQRASSIHQKRMKEGPGALVGQKFISCDNSKSLVVVLFVEREVKMKINGDAKFGNNVPDPRLSFALRHVMGSSCALRKIGDSRG